MTIATARLLLPSRQTLEMPSPGGVSMQIHVLGVAWKVSCREEPVTKEPQKSSRPLVDGDWTDNKPPLPFTIGIDIFYIYIEMSTC